MSAKILFINLHATQKKTKHPPQIYRVCWAGHILCIKHLTSDSACPLVCWDRQSSTRSWQRFPRQLTKCYRAIFHTKGWASPSCQKPLRPPQNYNKMVSPDIPPIFLTHTLTNARFGSLRHRELVVTTVTLTIFPV